MLDLVAWVPHQVVSEEANTTPEVGGFPSTTTGQRSFTADAPAASSLHLISNPESGITPTLERLATYPEDTSAIEINIYSTFMGGGPHIVHRFVKIEEIV